MPCDKASSKFSVGLTWHETLKYIMKCWHGPVFRWWVSQTKWVPQYLHCFLDKILISWTFKGISVSGSCFMKCLLMWCVSAVETLQDARGESSRKPFSSLLVVFVSLWNSVCESLMYCKVCSIKLSNCIFSELFVLRLRWSENEMGTAGFFWQCRMRLQIPEVCGHQWLACREEPTRPFIQKCLKAWNLIIKIYLPFKQHICHQPALSCALLSSLCHVLIGRRKICPSVPQREAAIDCPNARCNSGFSPWRPSPLSALTKTIWMTTEAVSDCFLSLSGHREKPTGINMPTIRFSVPIVPFLFA